MRTFIIRARKGTTHFEKIKSQIGTKEHFEVIAHSVMNAFFISNGFRKNVELYIILDSAKDFPRTLKLSGHEGLSINGFHEEAILNIVEKALKHSQKLMKNETQIIAPGLEISGFGFEKLAKELLKKRSVYLLDRKGKDIRSIDLPTDPVFILSDHLAMPKNSVKGLKRYGLQSISLGKTMLFASQCVTLINHELDRSTIP